jgi:hypothetical protein
MKNITTHYNQYQAEIIYKSYSKCQARWLGWKDIKVDSKRWWSPHSKSEAAQLLD